MSGKKRYLPAVVSVALMVSLLLLLYPHYQYYVDPDGTSYLTIVRRYVSGDWDKAINGYWSPWACWLTALLANAGLAVIASSVVVNSLGGICFLFISQSFFLRFDVERRLQWILNITLSLFLCYAVFWQSFDDLWECFFLLGALRIMLSENYTGRPGLWVLTGIIGALAYFAKSYSFPFFILNTLCCVGLMSRDDRPQWLKIAAVSIGVMIFCALPWIWALHEKYGVWTTSTAGTLNTSWYLVGHATYRPELKGLLPPVYFDSPYFWEDPYVVNGDTPHFWDSWYLFGRQLLKIIHNLYKLLRSMLQLSLVFPLIAVLAWLLLASRKMKELFNPGVSVVALSFLLFPSGYLLINFESRYLWYMLPLGMVMGALALQQFSGKRWMSIICAVLFVIYPAWSLYNIYDAGKDEYSWAQELKQHNIRGGFVTIVPPGKFTQSAERLAYFSGNNLYSLKAAKITEGDLLAEMRSYGVSYFYVYTYAGNNFAGVLNKARQNGARVTEVSIGETNEIKVYKIN